MGTALPHRSAYRSVLRRELQPQLPSTPGPIAKLSCLALQIKSIYGI